MLSISSQLSQLLVTYAKKYFLMGCCCFKSSSIISVWINLWIQKLNWKENIRTQLSEQKLMNSQSHIFYSWKWLIMYSCTVNVVTFKTALKKKNISQPIIIILCFFCTHKEKEEEKEQSKLSYVVCRIKSRMETMEKKPWHVIAPNTKFKKKKKCYFRLLRPKLTPYPYFKV